MALGPFDDFFDMDHDGKLDFFEEGMKFAFYANMAKHAAKDDTDYSFRRRRRRSSYSDVPKHNYNNDNYEGFLDSSNFHCDRPTSVSFNPDGTYSSGCNKYDSVTLKASEAAPSKVEEKTNAAPPATVNIRKSENEKTEAKKSKSKTRKTFIIIIASLLVVFLAYVLASAAIHKNHIAQIEDYCIKQAKIVSYRYNLDFEKVELHENFGELSGSYSADYYLNGMGTLKYSQMYDLRDKLYCLRAPCGNEHVLVFLNLICSDGDDYKIYTSTRSINLNGKQVDNDFFNSESYKEIHPDNSTSTHANSYNRAPFVGMYVTKNDISHWSPGGTDYDTCSMTTNKYHYKTDDAYYVMWVNPKTNCIVKVQGGPSGKNVKKPTYSSSNDDDEYNVKDYSDPDDFYYDYYDDFYDYYDAEDYYYEHCD